MSERQPTSWRDGLPIHAAAESFPLLPPDELRAILKHGLTSPIVLWRPDPKGQALLLDGRGRLDAIEMVVGAPVVVGPPSIMVEGKNLFALNKVVVLDKSVDPWSYIVSANVHRRHLSVAQREEALAKIIAGNPEKSDRQLAREIGVDHKTIGRARAKGEDVGSIPHVFEGPQAAGTQGQQGPQAAGAIAARQDAPCRPSRVSRPAGRSVGYGKGLSRLRPQKICARWRHGHRPSATTSVPRAAARSSACGRATRSSSARIAGSSERMPGSGVRSKSFGRA